MKLNLVPTYVSKGSQAKVFIALAVLLVLLSCVIAGAMILMSQQKFAAAKERAESLQLPASRAYETSIHADRVIATATGIDKNLKLAQAMNVHNSAYINLYDEVLSYVPSFYRVNSISAQSNGPNSVTVNLSGFLRTFQQYADANLALLRIPGATNVIRENYTLTDASVPRLIESDQIGSPIKPEEANLPSDPWARFEELIARAGSAETGYQNGLNGYGTEEPDKGAAPGYSQVNFTITLTGRNLQAPNPMATVSTKNPAPGTPAPGTTAPATPATSAPSPAAGRE